MSHELRRMKKWIIPLLAGLMLRNTVPASLRIIEVDTGKSDIFWKCDKHNGFFPLDSGKVWVDRHNRLQKGIFYINIKDLQVLDLDSANYKTAKAILENTLKNEFFEVDKYPLSYFKMEEVMPAGNDWMMEGDLFMHGTAVCIRFEGRYDFTPDAPEWFLESETFKIDRTDWGIYRLSPKRPYPDDEHGWTVPDTVEITVKLRFHKPAE